MILLGGRRAYTQSFLSFGTETLKAQALRPYKNFVVKPVQQIIIPQSCDAKSQEGL